MVKRTFVYQERNGTAIQSQLEGEMCAYYSTGEEYVETVICSSCSFLTFRKFVLIS